MTSDYAVGVVQLQSALACHTKAFDLALKGLGYAGNQPYMALHCSGCFNLNFCSTPPNSMLSLGNGSTTYLLSGVLQAQ